MYKTTRKWVERGNTEEIQRKHKTPKTLNLNSEPRGVVGLDALV